MNPLQLELTRLIGKKELSFGCLFRYNYPSHFKDTPQSNKIRNKIYTFNGGTEYKILTFDKGWVIITDIEIESSLLTEIIGHPATLSDFHRWMNENDINFIHYRKKILIGVEEDDGCQYVEDEIDYDSSKDLLDQEEETLKQIVELIKSNQSL